MSRRGPHQLKEGDVSSFPNGSVGSGRPRHRSTSVGIPTARVLGFRSTRRSRENSVSTFLPFGYGAAQALLIKSFRQFASLSVSSTARAQPSTEIVRLMHTPCA